MKESDPLLVGQKVHRQKSDKESMRDMHTGTSISQADKPYLTVCPKDTMK